MARSRQRLRDIELDHVGLLLRAGFAGTIPASRPMAGNVGAGETRRDTTIHAFGREHSRAATYWWKKEISQRGGCRPTWPHQCGGRSLLIVMTRSSTWM